MAKTTGPLMSLGASGSVAKTLTFATWKGRQYVRQLVIPANPQTALQMANRAMWAFLSQAWKTIGSTPQNSWTVPAAATSVSPFNAFVQGGQKRFTNGSWPTQIYNVTPATYTASMNVATTVGGIRSATVTVKSTDTTGTTWAAVIYRSLTTGFTPAISDIVDISPCNATTDTVWIDSPLAAGTYYYVIAPISTDGQIGTAHAQTSATVTAA